MAGRTGVDSIDGARPCGSECSECVQLRQALLVLEQTLCVERQRNANVLSMLADSVAIAQRMATPPA